MENDEREENSPVEIIYERLKRFRTNEIDGRERVRLREEKGWEGGKNKGNLGRLEETPLRKLRNDLADVENDRIISKRSMPVRKELT